MWRCEKLKERTFWPVLELSLEDCKKRTTFRTHIVILPLKESGTISFKDAPNKTITDVTSLFQYAAKFSMLLSCIHSMLIFLQNGKGRENFCRITLQSPLFQSKLKIFLLLHCLDRLDLKYQY